MKVAALMRSHLADSAKAADLAHKMAGVRDWDFHVLADETGGPASSYGHPKLSHNVAMCTSLGLQTQTPKCFWYFGDYSLYCAHHLRPDYDFYLMFDYDIDLAPEAPDYLHRLGKELAGMDGRVDLLGPTVGPIPGDRPGRPHRFAHPYKAMFAVIGLSRRALVALYEGRLEEKKQAPVSEHGGVHCEYYVPSKLAELGGFTMLGLNDIVPGSVAKASFNSTFARPFRYDTGAPVESQLIHPVVDTATFLRKSFGVEMKRGREDIFQAHLDALREQGADPALLQEYEQKLALHQSRVSRASSSS